MQGKWTHNICLECWTEQNPNRVPHKLAAPDKEICCFCGIENKDGIYIRADGDDLPCKGSHV